MKIEGRIPSKAVLNWCQKNSEKVRAIDYVQGAYDVLMEKGWSVDLYGDHMHTIIEPTAKRCLEILRTASREYCTKACDE